jgi:hypothetical protein
MLVMERLALSNSLQLGNKVRFGAFPSAWKCEQNYREH